MVGDIARRIGDLVVSGGVGSCWGRVGFRMEGGVDAPHLSEDITRDRPIIVGPRFENDLIPESTELVLEFRRRILYLEFGSRFRSFENSASGQDESPKWSNCWRAM